MLLLTVLTGNTMLLLVLTSATVSAYDVRTLTAMSAASHVSHDDAARYGHEGSICLRGVSSLTHVPLARPYPSRAELGGVADEMILAAAIVSRLTGAKALRDPFGDWCDGWDNAYDHYVYWRMMEQAPKSVAMVVLPREPLCVTLRGYPARVVKRTAYSSTAYPRHWCGTDLSARTDLAEPEIELDQGDALVLDGTNSEGLGGLGGGHLVYRFEMCDADSESALWVTPSVSPESALLQEFAVAARRGVVHS